jgi:hypothetical protein
VREAYEPRPSVCLIAAWQTGSDYGPESISGLRRKQTINPSFVVQLVRVLAITCVIASALPTFAQQAAGSTSGVVKVEDGSMIAAATLSYGQLKPPRFNTPLAMKLPAASVVSTPDVSQSIQNLNAGVCLVCICVRGTPYPDSRLRSRYASAASPPESCSSAVENDSPNSVQISMEPIRRDGGGRDRGAGRALIRSASRILPTQKPECRRQAPVTSQSYL